MEQASSVSVTDRLHARRISQILTVTAVAVPLASLVGWLAAMPLLTSYGEQFIPMAPSTAIGFILLSLPLLTALHPQSGPAGRHGFCFAGMLVAAYGFLVFFAWLTGLPTNPDDMLFKEMGTLGAHRVGRMSSATGVLFLLSGISLTALGQGLTPQRAANAWLELAGVSGFMALLTGAIFALGYALGRPLLYESTTIPVALPTALSFLLLGGALTATAVFASPATGHWYRTLNDMPVSTLLRLGLGVILASVLLLGTLIWRQTELLWLQTRMMKITLDHIKEVDDSAKGQGDKIFEAATEQKNTINRQLAVISAAILLLSLLISWRLLSGIKAPLGQLTAAAEQFRQGQTGARSGYVAANEFGVLSATFNAMADTVETQMRTMTTQNIELEQQKLQLNKANRLKNVFLANMSHELRTPLTSVIALSGVLSRRLARTIPEVEYGYLEVIERNARHLLAMINDILDLSRIEAGQEELTVSQFSLRQLVAEALAMFKPQAQEKNITLANLVAEELPSVTSDPDKVRHILENLIANAVKFTRAGSVEVSARLADNGLQVAVRDTGIGIAAEQLPYIFEEFRQADEGISRQYGGTGLGLAIARKYAALLQGDIAVESAAGQGSTFTLRLPSWKGET